MDQSIPSSKETNKTDRKGVNDAETTTSSDVSSFYEINVHEDFSSESNSSKGSSNICDLPKLILKVKKVEGNKENKESSHRNAHSSLENLKKIANPLIESYYPFLKDHQIGNITIEVNVNPLISNDKDGGKSKENLDKSVDGKCGENSEDSTWNKSNESATSDNVLVKEEKKLAISSFNNIRKKLKRQILQYMLTKKDGEFSDVEWKDVEDQLHIHHHEHHHHYHMDTAKLKDESEFSFLRGGPNSPIHWSEDKENEYGGSDVLNTDFGVKERERSNYLYDCSRQHPVNFLKNSCNLSNLTFVRRSKEGFMKIADKYSSRSGPIRPMKKTSSMDSVSTKKSDLMVFHNYSDTEVSKCDSEEGSFTDVPSSRSTINLSRNMKKGTKTENKSSKPLWGEREVVAGNGIQGNDSVWTVLKKMSDKECDQKERPCVEMEKINKKPRNLSDLVDRLSQSEEKSEGSKGEFKILLEKKMKKSVETDESEKQGRDYLTRPVAISSSEGEPADVKTDKETSDENVKSTATIKTSSRDTATLVKTLEDGSSKSREKFIRSRTPKSAGNSGDKLRSYSRKKIESKEEVALKTKQTFGLSGNSKSKARQNYRSSDIYCQKSDHYLDSREVSVQFWSQKIRQELKEIKKELRSLEKKDMRELTQNRTAETRGSRLDECFENGISVYSNRTYIVGASHFKLVTDFPKRDFSTSFKNRNMITQKQIMYLYSRARSRGWGGVQHHTES